jgi:aryl-alcohol dehydrogenase-like predicted oxidoreductase
VLGFGAWPIGGGMGSVDERTAIATVHAALDAGITLVDTAQAYRASESVIGKALSGGRRERCFLATKASFDYSPAGIAAALEASLAVLGTDRVDLYQIHSHKPEFPIPAAMETLVRLREQGKIRWIGVSNYKAPQMAEALRCAPVVSNQVRYNLFDRDIEREDLGFCARSGVGVLVHSPLAKGLLTGRYTRAHRFPEDDERSRFPRFQGELFARYIAAAGRVAEVAAARQLSLVQLAIAWCLARPEVSCVLVGAKSPQQVREHLAAADARLGAEELAALDRISAEAPAPPAQEGAGRTG